MNQTIKELLKQIPFKPAMIGRNRITFLNQRQEILEISVVGDATSSTIQYRLAYTNGGIVVGNVNFCDVEEKVTNFMARR